MELRLTSPRRIIATTFKFLLFLLAIRVKDVQAGANDCLYKHDYTLANCSHLGLNYVPWRLHKNINSIDLSSNNFTVLEHRSFINYAYISKLYLRNNSMRELQSEAFKKLTYLRTLDLSNNKLTQVPIAAINVVASSLKQLILAGNKLTTIADGTFSKLRKLQRLDLSGNSIYRVDGGAFAKLSSLTVLKLRHNAIKRLPVDAFQDFPRESMTRVQLYDNRWVCDCHSRWLWEWLNATDSSVWDSPGYAIRCDGPAIVRDEALDTLPLDKLVCEAKMKISGSTRELDNGANSTLKCQYWTVPKAKAIWLKNAQEIDERKYSKKYDVTSWEVEGKTDTYASELVIRDFKYADIAKYKCLIENIRGVAFMDYKLTLKGVDFDSVVVLPPVGQKADESGGVDTRSIVIAVAVVCGIVLIIVIAVLIFCSVNRMQRKKQKKRDVIVQHVKDHFIKNSEDTNGTLDSNGKGKSSPLTRGLEDGSGGANPQEDTHSCSNYTNDSTYKPPLYMDEAEPMLIMGGGGAHSPGSPLNNGNTYVSFGDSEFTDPCEFPTHVPVYHPQQTPNMSARGGGGGGGYGPPNSGMPGGGGVIGGSQEGSATPLLDRYTPVFADEPDGPIMEDYASYPVYDSLTNSLQHPRLTPPLINGSGHYSVYNTADPGPLYGTSPMPHYNHHHHHPGSVSSSYGRNGGGGGGGGALDRSMGSSIYYPNSNSAGSLPRTPGSVRSVAAVPPWSSSGAGDGSPPIIENHYHPPPLVHRPNPEYRDYRDMRYPSSSVSSMPPTTATPPSNRLVSNAKNIGGGYSPVPSSGPRKPPRVYIPGSGGNGNGRDCMELTTPGGSTHDSSDYITSSDAQQYGQNYGITPGTPV